MARLLGMTAVALLLEGSGLSQTTEIVSVDSAGNEGNANSWRASTSGDGRYVAFQSNASNLVPGDTNGDLDVFVHDRNLNTTERVSVSSILFVVQGNSDSSEPSISEDGRYVAFLSWATNLVSGDTNADGDIFVHDRKLDTTVRVSLSSSGKQANDYSDFPSISADGRYVAFTSEATNLVTGDTNGYGDVFVHDRQTGTLERVSVDSFGNQGNSYSWIPSISGDGRYVAFNSQSDNLVPGDMNGDDVFVHDRQTGTTELISVDSFGNQGNGGSYFPSISRDGRYVAFESGANNLTPSDTNFASDIFVHDRQTGATNRVSLDPCGAQTDNDSYRPSISLDGNYVAFDSWATNLVSGDTNGWEDTFVHDRETSAIERVSIDPAGNQGNASSAAPSISRDGRYVAFESDASNLVPGDTNGFADIFVRDRGSVSPGVYCTAGTSASGCQASISATGTASASAVLCFELNVTGAEGNKDGLFFFGANGRQASPWGNGTSFQCVVPPVTRTGLLLGNGTAGLCDGTFSLNLNVLWCPTCSKANKNPGAGALVQAQLWYRDPQNTSNQKTSLSDAVEFLVGP